jgi:hypothetical protein
MYILWCMGVVVFAALQTALAGATRVSTFLITSSVSPNGVRSQRLSRDIDLEALRHAVPGEPGVDYPIYTSAPYNSFNCKGKEFGGGHVHIF